MKHKKIASMAALIVASLSAAHAQTITGWTFDNDGIGANASPAPSTGIGTATALGMSNSYPGPAGPTNAVSNPDILSSSGSSTPSLPDAWRVRGNGTAPNSANGWNSAAPIGTQGAEFSASTVGFDSITVSFDINTTAQAERNLAVLYTLDDTVGSPVWQIATITSAGGLGGSIQTGSGVNTIGGNYVQLSSAAGWNNGISASISGAGNDANFAIEIVNASTSTDNVNISGGAYNNSSGNWRYDNVDISGTPVPEPTTLALAGLGGLAALVAVRRRN